MPNTLAHSPANIVQQLLISLGIGNDPETSNLWPVYVSSEPDAPDNVITIYVTQGSGGGRLMTGELFGLYGFQVRIRSATHPIGWAKADEIQTALAESVYDETVHVGAVSYLVNCISQVGDILDLGKDATSKRSVFTLNAQVDLG